MKHHIYVYGSTTSGEVHRDSDVDILVVTNGSVRESEVDFPSAWSAYTVDKLIELHREGAMFSWHLYQSAKCIFTPNGIDFIKSLGEPGKYSNINNDYAMFRSILIDSIEKLNAGEQCSTIYELGIVYMALRDIGMHVSRYVLGLSDFSKYVNYRIDEGFSSILPVDVFNILLKCRSCTMRGVAEPGESDLIRALKYTNYDLVVWCDNIFNKALKNA